MEPYTDYRFVLFVSLSDSTMWPIEPDNCTLPQVGKFVVVARGVWFPLVIIFSSQMLTTNYLKRNADHFLYF